jgi:hypothetical protein
MFFDWKNSAQVWIARKFQSTGIRSIQKLFCGMQLKWQRNIQIYRLLIASQVLFPSRALKNSSPKRFEFYPNFKNSSSHRSQTLRFLKCLEGKWAFNTDLRCCLRWLLASQSVWSQCDSEEKIAQICWCWTLKREEPFCLRLQLIKKPILSLQLWWCLDSKLFGCRN